LLIKSRLGFTRPPNHAVERHDNDVGMDIDIAVNIALNNKENRNVYPDE